KVIYVCQGEHAQCQRDLVVILARVRDKRPPEARWTMVFGKGRCAVSRSARTGVDPQLELYLADGNLIDRDHQRPDTISSCLTFRDGGRKLDPVCQPAPDKLGGGRVNRKSGNVQVKEQRLSVLHRHFECGHGATYSALVELARRGRRLLCLSNEEGEDLDQYDRADIGLRRGEDSTLDGIT